MCFLKMLATFQTTIATETKLADGQLVEVTDHGEEIL